MDAVDLFILRRIGLYAFHAERGSLEATRPSAIARAAGVSLRTVKERLARLRRLGVLEGFVLVPNPRHLGLSSAWVLFRASEESAERLLKERRLVEGLHDLVVFVGGWFMAQLYFESESALARRLDIVATLAEGAEPVKRFDAAPPPVRRALTPLDWRLVAALRRRPREEHPTSGLDRVARELGVSARTIKRHFARMAEEMSVDVEAALRPDLMPDAFPVHVVVDLVPGAARAAASGIARELAPRAYFILPPSGDLASASFAVLHARRPQDISELAHRAEAVEGVAHAHAFVQTMGAPNLSCLDEPIELRARHPAADEASARGALTR